MLSRRGPGKQLVLIVICAIDQVFTLFNSFHHGHKLRSFRELLSRSCINRRTYSRQFGGPLASSVFLIVLSIAGENHLHTVWRVCFGIGILLPLTVLVFRLRMLSSKLYRKGAIKSDHFPPMSHGLSLIHLTLFRKSPILPGSQVLSEITDWHLWCMVRLVVARVLLIILTLLRFLYDFVSFPNGLFSGTIISSVVRDNDIKKIAEWQLLLSSISLPGVLVGALLCNPLGRRNTVSSPIKVSYLNLSI